VTGIRLSRLLSQPRQTFLEVLYLTNNCEIYVSIRKCTLVRRSTNVALIPVLSRFLFSNSFFKSTTRRSRILRLTVSVLPTIFRSSSMQIIHGKFTAITKYTLLEQRTRMYNEKMRVRLSTLTIHWRNGGSFRNIDKSIRFRFVQTFNF
jgi:hypothetical protein